MNKYWRWAEGVAAVIRDAQGESIALLLHGSHEPPFSFQTWLRPELRVEFIGEVG